MFESAGLTTLLILDAFTDAVAARGGLVTDTFDDGRRLFTRSVFALTEDVRPGDTIKGGVALKASEGDVTIYPYIFRLVCQNGAIMAHAIEAHHLADLHLQEPEHALETIREGIEACSSEEVFAASASRMITAATTEADLALNMMPFIARFRDREGSAMFSLIMDQFFRGGDDSVFGLANAVTATAHDTRDPELRWDLEELGGGIAVSCGTPGAAWPRIGIPVGCR